MKALFVRFVREEKGEDLIEYGLLAAFVAVVATAVVIGDPVGLRAAIINAYKSAADALTS